MHSFNSDGEQQSHSEFHGFKPSKGTTVTTAYNQKFQSEGPQSLKKDYDDKYKALEQQAVQRLNTMEITKQDQADEIQYYKNENMKFQEYFDKVLTDNKVLYMRCKELEQYLAESNPAFKQQYQSIIQENEELRRVNYKLMNEQATGTATSFGPQPADVTLGQKSSHRLLTLQREVEDLRSENYELKMRLQTQVQLAGQHPTPRTRTQLITPPQQAPYIHQHPSGIVHQSSGMIQQSNHFRGHPQIGGYAQPYPQQDMYCNQIISSNEHHNRAVLDRCKSIVSAHNYY